MRPFSFSNKHKTVVLFSGSLSSTLIQRLFTADSFVNFNARCSLFSQLSLLLFALFHVRRAFGEEAKQLSHLNQQCTLSASKRIFSPHQGQTGAFSTVIPPSVRRAIRIRIPNSQYYPPCPSHPGRCDNQHPHEYNRQYKHLLVLPFRQQPQVRAPPHPVPL